MVALASGLMLAAPADAQVRRFAFDRSAASTSDTVVPTGRAYDGDYGFEPNNPAAFSIRAAPGNYRVTVTFGRPRTATDTTIKAEARRLMLSSVQVPGGRQVRREFVVNVRDARLGALPSQSTGTGEVRLKPRERGSPTWDDRLTLEFLGPQPGVAAITVEPAQLPTVFLLGDSTVTDQQAEPAASWGQMLTGMLAPTIAVANHAESGEAMKSFVTAGRLAKVLESVKPGDWALIQFGHNDQKENHPQTYVAADSTYRSWLRVFIDEFRRRGATPVLVTSPERRNWVDGGRIRPTLDTYAEAVRAVGRQEGVAVIDLNADSIRLYEALGPERAPLAFNDGGRDATHHNNYGAWLLARAIVGRLPTAAPAFGPYVRRDLPAFDPAKPPLPGTVVIAPSTTRDSTRPDGS